LKDVLRVAAVLFAITAILDGLSAREARSASNGVQAADELAGEQLMAALECAALASAVSDPSHVDQATRLVTYAFSVAPKAIPTLFATSHGSTATLGRYATLLQSRGVDFLLGISFEIANNLVDEDLDRQVPHSAYVGQVELYLSARSLAAEGEFDKRNCALIGN